MSAQPDLNVVLGGVDPSIQIPSIQVADSDVTLASTSQIVAPPSALGRDLIIDGCELVQLLHNLPEYIHMVLTANGFTPTPAHHVRYRPFVMEQAGPGDPILVVNIMSPVRATLHVHRVSANRARMSLTEWPASLEPADLGPPTAAQQAALAGSNDPAVRLGWPVAPSESPLYANSERVSAEPQRTQRPISDWARIDQVDEVTRREIVAAARRHGILPGEPGMPSPPPTPEMQQQDEEIRQQIEEFGRPLRTIELD